MSPAKPASHRADPPPATPRPRRWSRPEVWMLGVFSVLGLIGFVATFVLIVMRSPRCAGVRAL